MKTKDQPQRNIYWKILKKFFYWVIPSVILVSIFLTIDITRLLEILKIVNPWMLLLGLAIFPSMIFLGAYRWKVILIYYLNHDVSSWFVIHHYWIGLAIGKFVPSSVTWDVYRVAAAGKKFGDYTFQTIAVILEKVAALLVASLLILCIYPFIKSDISADIFLVQIKTLFAQFFYGNSMLVYISVIIISLLLVLPAGYFALKWFKKTDINLSPALILPLFKLKLTTLVLLYSVGIFIGMATANYYFFYSLNTQLPFVVHLFLMPIFAVLLLLPVTVAGLGLREGLFVIFYGLFGIPMETALIVSFMNLTASLLNSAIGGIIMLTSNSEVKKNHNPNI